MLALILGCWAAPRVYHRLFFNFPAGQRPNWEQVLESRQRAFSVPWQDPRPLVIMAGDSQIELGNWYELFAGGQAVRNCGLSSARIADVTRLVSAIGDRHPRLVVLMCGINDFFAGRTQAELIQDYDGLLETVRTHLNPESIIVLSAMPLRASPVDHAGQAFNAKVARFNTALADVCRRQQARFLDVSPAVTDDRGGLAAGLTFDGLHLNPAGYHRLAAAIAPQLSQPANAP